MKLWSEVWFHESSLLEWHSGGQRGGSPGPQDLNTSDIILKVSSTAICGSDLHLYSGVVPGMRRGDILGHEFMGEVVEMGPSVKTLRVGDRVVVPFPISCGHGYFCKNELWSLCDNSNPKAAKAETVNTYSTSGIFGFSELFRSYAGGQAEYVRVPYGDAGPFRVDPSLPDKKLLFLSDIFPTGFMAAEFCEIEPGDTIAIWGCGPVGQFAIRSARLLGAEKIIAIDRYPARLNLAARVEGAELINYQQSPEVVHSLKQLTGSRGPDACIDAVGTEAHGMTWDAMCDRAKFSIMVGSDRLHALREAIQACRKGGVISIIGVYGGFPDHFPLGVAFAKGLRFRMAQCHVHRYLEPLYQMILNEELDLSEIVSHQVSLDDGPHAYKAFRDKEDAAIKYVLKP